MSHRYSTSVGRIRSSSTSSGGALEDPNSRVAAKSMRNELEQLSQTLPEGSQERANFSTQMDEFYRLFLRYLDEQTKHVQIDWDKINSPAPDQIIPYQSLEKKGMGDVIDHLGKLAVLKLNGGLGTTMGCVGPKSVIEVRNGQTFLDLTVHQIEHLNEISDVDVPLVLMNSFNTDEETKRIVRKYTEHNITILTFNQSRYPRISKESNHPLASSADDDISMWYPPGHGDLFQSLDRSGLLDKLIESGKEYLFISNVDNLGATVDATILNQLVDSGAEFIMEVTDKTKADIKGGTLIDYEGHVRLLEIAQVPAGREEEFKSIKKFKIFNTNNLWVNLRAIKRVLEAKELNLEIIVNNKTAATGEKVIQLETAVGAAIKHFKGARGINVPRSRFLPVKSTSDLFLVTSDLYQMDHGELQMNPQRMFATVPLVKLGDHFKKVQDFLERFRTPPHILELDHLTVTGDVTFGRRVVLRGTVIIVANHGARIDIPSGSILENKVVSGNLRILEH